MAGFWHCYTHITLAGMETLLTVKSTEKKHVYFRRLDVWYMVVHFPPQHRDVLRNICIWAVLCTMCFALCPNSFHFNQCPFPFYVLICSGQIMPDVSVFISGTFQRMNRAYTLHIAWWGSCQRCFPEGMHVPFSTAFQGFRAYHVAWLGVGAQHSHEMPLTSLNIQ